MSNKRTRFSYSALSQFEHCPYSYYLKYVAKNRSSVSSLSLELGSIAHKVRELLSSSLMIGESPDYNTLKAILYDGFTGKDKNSGEPEILPGCSELKTKYFEDWIKPDEKSGLSYERKLELFLAHLPDEAQDQAWRTIAVELPFEVSFDNVVLFGFIDKLSENAAGQLRITDYKTSKAVYRPEYVKTSLQMLVYDIAVQTIYPGRDIIRHEYDFVFIGQQQSEDNGACTKGWLKRGETKLRKLLKDIAECEHTGIWKPKPTPLCFWCDYCKTAPTADSKLNHLCPFYSLWTPGQKTYDVAQKWQADTKAEDISKQAEETKKAVFWF